jgi:hypothetical protein
MKVVTLSEAGATVVLSSDEIGILNNALNEVCNGLEIPEFATRMGADIDEVSHLLHEIHSLGRAMNENAHAGSPNS